MNINFENITDLKQYLNSAKHWVYCSDNNTPWNPADVNQPKIYERVSKNAQGYLQFHRFADEPKDISPDGSLRPRIEIVPIFARIPKLKYVHIRYVVSAVEGGNNFRGMIFQLMDHTPDGDTLPIFQFEIRGGYLHTRWCSVNSNGTSGGTNIYRIAQPKWGDGPDSDWHILDVYAYLSHNNDGYIRVYRNGIYAWERRGRNASVNSMGIQLQYGIYGVEGFSLKTQVKSLSWEIVDTIPTTQELQPKYLTILAIGQSNMIAGSSKDDTNARVHRNYSERVIWYDYNVTHTFSNNPLMNFQTTSSSGSCAKFCASELIPNLSNDTDILIIPMAQSGSGTSLWLSELCDKTIDACKEAFSKKIGCHLDLVIWLQGETDRNKTDQYGSNLARVMDKLKDGIPEWDEKTCIVCAEISNKIGLIANKPEAGFLINSQIAKYVESKKPRSGIVRSGNFATNPDNIHFNPTSIESIGKEFAKQYLVTL